MCVGGGGGGGGGGGQCITCSDLFNPVLPGILLMMK